MKSLRVVDSWCRCGPERPIYCHYSKAVSSLGIGEKAVRTGRDIPARCGRSHGFVRDKKAVRKTVNHWEIWKDSFTWPSINNSC